MELLGSRYTSFSQIDRAAASEGADEFGFKQNGENKKFRFGTACAGDGHRIQIGEEDDLCFQTRWIPFTEDVRVSSTLPDNVPVEEGSGEGISFNWTRKETWHP